MNKKVTAIVSYHDSTIYNITFILPNGNSIQMYTRKNDILAPCYNSLTHMYTAVIILAKNNGFIIPYTKMAGAKWYDIFWVDSENPEDICRYAYCGQYGKY